MDAKTGNDGFFTTKPLANDTGNRIGSVYIEVMTYDHVIKSAETRIKIYHEKLGFYS